MNETTRKFKIRVTPKKTADGRSFNTFKTFSKNGRSIEVKFNKEVNNRPEKDCVISVLEDNAHLNDSGEYPVLWIKKIESIEDNASANAEASKAKLAQYFD